MNAFSDALYEVFSCAAETYRAKGLRNLLADKAALHQCKPGMLALGPMRGLGFKRFQTTAVTIRGIELAEKIKKQRFNLKPPTRKAITAPEIWAAVLAA